MANKKILVLTPSKKKITEVEKTKLTEVFEPLIDQYKKKFIEATPNKEENYVINFYSKFYRGVFYLCAYYKAEYVNRISDGFEIKFARLEFIDDNKYDLAYFRHTDQWWTIERNVTMEFCLTYITDNSLMFF
jgi:hypothetical protein